MVVVVVGSRVVAPPLLRVVRCLSHIVLWLRPRPCLVSMARYRMVAFLPGRRIGCFFLCWFPVASVSDVSSISYIERGSVWLFPLFARRHTCLIPLLRSDIDTHWVAPFLFVVGPACSLLSVWSRHTICRYIYRAAVCPYLSSTYLCLPGGFSYAAVSPMQNWVLWT